MGPHKVRFGSVKMLRQREINGEGVIAAADPEVWRDIGLV